MRRALCALVLAVPAMAQDAAVARGERVFATNCSVPYCHGANGTAGRAPRLIGHTFTARELRSTVSNGISDKGMPPFAGQLSSEDLDAVIGYLMTLRGSGATSTPVRNSVPDSPGKALFFDAVRMGGCGRCHELERRGSPVAQPIQTIPADLRAVATSHVVTVSTRGESPFPGIVLERTEKRVRVYDLSSRLPVLRTFAPGDVQVSTASNWSHRDAVSGYSDAELREIAAYVQSTITK